MNPFRTAPVAAAPQADAMVAIGSSREVAEVQTAMLVAQRFPRREVECMDRILQACTRPTLAEGALYEYARGGSNISGPSIRLAECHAQNWGHIDFGWRVLEERPGVSKVQSFCWDMQTGVRSQMVFDVTHERMAGGTKKQLHDPRDIYEHISNAASRRLRACILRTIPGDVVESAVRQCQATLKLKVEVTPERLQSLVTQFAEYGVTKAQLEKRIQRRLEAMTPGIMVQLGRVFTSLRDGMSEPSDWFDQGGETPPAPAQDGAGAPPVQPVKANPRQAVRERLQAGKAARDASANPSPAADPLPPHPSGSPALQDIIRFARAAADLEDVERVRQIALQLETEEEAHVAQSHINAALARIGV
jgi:hypothetical protein